ncbi:MAG: hypothetical protein F6J87_26755 [Spirulina sp. SIO3F2]|nr:hypothetical protein [Spirulina sp. SIO3F2]
MLIITPPSPWKNSALTPFISGLLVSSLLGMGQLLFVTSPAIAQISQATITEIVDGDEVFIDKVTNPAVEGETDGEAVPAEVDAVAQFQETVRTEDARAALLFDNGAAGRIGPNSQIIVGQCIEVKQGLLLAVGPANGCTATFAVGVEGTIYAIAIDETGAQAVKVLEGEVIVTLNEPVGNDGQDAKPTLQPDSSDAIPAPEPEALPKQIDPEPLSPEDPVAPEVSVDEEQPGVESTTEPEFQTQTIQAGEQIAITPAGEFGEKSFISAEDMLLILDGVLFDGFEQELPGMAALQSTIEELYPDLDLPNLPGFDLPLPIRPSIPSPF